MKKTKLYLLLHALMLIYSFSPVCSKLAGQQEFLSFKFFLFYGLVLFILGIYAIFWQQIIKRMPLTTAYTNKAITVIWGMVWGVIVFGETITPLKLLGAAVVVAGVVVFALADKDNDEKEAKNNA